MAPALSLAPRFVPDRSWWGEHSPASHASLVVVIGSLVVLALVSGAFWAGRMVEQRTQLGYLLAAAPSLEQLQTATRSADSLSMRFLLQMGRLRKH